MFLFCSVFLMQILFLQIRLHVLLCYHYIFFRIKFWILGNSDGCIVFFLGLQVKVLLIPMCPQNVKPRIKMPSKWYIVHKSALFPNQHLAPFQSWQEANYCSFRHYVSSVFLKSRPQTINLYDGFVCHDDVVVVASTSDLTTGTLRLVDYLGRAHSDWQLIIGDPSANYSHNSRSRSLYDQEMCFLR